MCFSHDIWHQILQYFEHEEEDLDAPGKRTVLLSMAVTSRMLSSLALATLWKNMSSLRPIVNIINSFTTAPSLNWIRMGGNSGYWVRLPIPSWLTTILADMEAQNQEFLKKPGGNQIDLRVKEYLSRIRLLRIWEEKERERTLWPILIAWFSKDGPLLPNLQELIILFMDNFVTSYQYLPLMASSRLKSISTSGAQCSTHLVAFYQLLLSRGCSLTEVEYTGDLSLPATLIFFEKLNTLVVLGPYEHATHTSPFSLLELLQQLPSLRHLEIDLRTLRIRGTKPLDSFEHLSLETLALEGSTTELLPLLSFDMTCPLVRKFSLRIQFNAKLPWRYLSEEISSIFPNLCELTLNVPAPVDIPQLALSDIEELLSHPMELVVFSGVPNKLSRKDLRQMLKTWPELHTLTLAGGIKSFNAQGLLSKFTYPNLHTLHLPLDFTSLASPLASAPVTQKSPLKHLIVAPPTRFPSTFKKKLTLVQNLLVLLPELETVKSGDQRLWAEAADLQDIIKGMLTVVAARKPSSG